MTIACWQFFIKGSADSAVYVTAFNGDSDSLHGLVLLLELIAYYSSFF